MNLRQDIYEQAIASGLPLEVAKVVADRCCDDDPEKARATLAESREIEALVRLVGHPSHIATSFIACGISLDRAREMLRAAHRVHAGPALGLHLLALERLNRNRKS